MKLASKRRITPRRGTRRVVMAMVGVATVSGLALGSGAWAERLAALKQPTLETLLSEREALEDVQRPSPQREDILDHYESLRQRRQRIEDELPRAVKPALWRRPPLDAPPIFVPIRRPARAVDLDPADPDAVLRGEVK